MNYIVKLTLFCEKKYKVYTQLYFKLYLEFCPKQAVNNNKVYGFILSHI